MSFNKNDTWMAKGLAILMMYWHHFFLPGRFENYPTNFFPITPEIGVYLASFCKICVGIFAFLSAYGMTISLKREKSNLFLSSKAYVSKTYHRWFSLMKGWTFVFLLCEVLTFLIDKRLVQVYGGGRIGILNLDVYKRQALFRHPLENGYI